MALFKQTAFDEESCEDGSSTGKGAKAKFQAAERKLQASGICTPADIGSADMLIATLSADRSNPASLDARNGDVFCDASSGVTIASSDADEAGFVPATAETLRCACGVYGNITKLARRGCRWSPT